jgi:hypothetical protein
LVTIIRGNAIGQVVELGGILLFMVDNHREVGQSFWQWWMKVLHTFKQSQLRVTTNLHAFSRYSIGSSKERDPHPKYI